MVCLLRRICDLKGTSGDDNNPGRKKRGREGAYVRTCERDSVSQVLELSQILDLVSYTKEPIKIIHDGVTSNYRFI